MKKQLKFLLQVKDEVSRANQTIIDIRNVKKDLTYLSEKVKDKSQILSIINRFMDDSYVVENNIHMTLKIKVDKIL